MSHSYSGCLELSLEEIDELKDKLEKKELSEKDIERLKAIVNSYIHFHQMLGEKNITIKKLLRVFGSKSEKSKDILKGSPVAVDTEETDGVEKLDVKLYTDSIEVEKSKPRKKGHGRNGASAYKGAEQIYVPHPDLKVGDKCPECPSGKVFQYKRAGKIVRIMGQSPIVAKVYELEKLRCSSCLTIFTAPIPEEAGDKKYNEEAGAVIGLLKYGNGFAFYRFQNFQNNFGIPLPASTQWEIAEGVGFKVAPVYNELVRVVAQQDVVHNDDTNIKILSVIKEKGDERLTDTGGNENSERTGTFTTGVVAEVEGHEVALYFSGRNHSGENIEEVLRKRQRSLGPPIQMCDAEAKNIPKELETIIANCLGHGRRKFVELYDVFPKECRIVIEFLAEVYKNESIAKERKLSPRERLEFHQYESGPVMEKLKNWLDLQFEEKRVEPNSSLGKAIAYMQNHWIELTVFLRIEKAPLDNNIVERALKFAILNRKNSYFFKTEHGAKIGDIFMSIIKTCYTSDVNAFEYLTILQKHWISVKENPERWLPWNFKNAMMALNHVQKI